MLYCAPFPNVYVIPVVVTFLKVVVDVTPEGPFEPITLEVVNPYMLVSYAQSVTPVLLVCTVNTIVLPARLKLYP